jgi:hypothetical protein
VPDAQGIPRVHRKFADGTTQSLEIVRRVTRPNGRTEGQLADFMTYLNADSTAVDDAERAAAARLTMWLLDDPSAGEAQIRHAVETARLRIRETQHKVPTFTAKDWREVVWVNDIRHQGRGGYAAINNALKSASPLAELAKIGDKTYLERIATVGSCIEQLDKAASLDDWSLDDLVS